MFDMAEKLEFTATSEDGRVLDALAHAQQHQSARGEYITAFDEEGKEVDISFATQNWRKVVVDKTRTGQYVRKHFEAMVFTYLAEELRCGDVAVLGSEEYADWSEQLLEWEAVQEKLADYMVEVGLCEAGETAEFDAQLFRRQLEDKLRSAAAAADDPKLDVDFTPLRDQDLATAGFGQAARPARGRAGTSSQRWYTLVLRYFRPESTSKVAILAFGPRRCPTWIAARTFAPDDVPANNPSSRARRLAMSPASAVEIGTISSGNVGSHIGGV
jgi:hypothetical protein